jgi:hypothetical protein
MAGFGKQFASNFATTPQWSLTSKHDKSWAKVLITPEHNKVNFGKQSPGAIYSPKEEFGVHPEHSNWVRDKKLKPTQGNGMTQGPDAFYDVRQSNYCSPPQGKNLKTTYGSSERFPDVRDPGIGPGQYQHKSSIQAGLKAKSFGTSFRAYDKVMVPGEFGTAREFRGRASPGPGPYRQDFGKDSLAFQMSLDKKLKPVKLSDTPITMGPGYYAPEKVKRGVLSSENTSGGVSFGKPRRKKHRFDFKRLGQCGNRVFGYIG